MKQSKRWIILCVVLLLLGIAGCFWLMKPSAGKMVEILQDGAVLYTLDLSQTEDQLLEISCHGSTNTVQVLDGHIRVLEAECPDNTCVHMGFLSDMGLPIVCLPNRLVIQFVNTAVDGTAF